MVSLDNENSIREQPNNYKNGSRLEQTVIIPITLITLKEFKESISWLLEWRNK